MNTLAIGGTLSVIPYICARMGFFGRADFNICSSDSDRHNETFVFSENCGMFNVVTMTRLHDGFLRRIERTYYIRPVDLFVDWQQIRKGFWFSSSDWRIDLLKGRL